MFKGMGLGLGKGLGRSPSPTPTPTPTLKAIFVNAGLIAYTSKSVREDK